MTSINTNVGAIYARTYNKRSTEGMRVAMTRLSSGLRVNTAADDAAGLAVSMKLRSQFQGIFRAISNSSDGISLAQTALSGIEEVQLMVQRMRELALQMHNGVYTDTDRLNAQTEINALIDEIIRITDTTSFNNVRILDGGYDQYIRSGNRNEEIVPIKIDGMGIFSFIRGVSSATGTSKTILRPFISANGGSQFDTPTIGTPDEITNEIIIANSSTSVGQSSFNTPLNSNADGTSSIDILTSSSGFGLSNFDITLASNATGLSQIDILTNTTANGVSNFDVAATSTATGSSTIIPNPLTTATISPGGASRFTTVGFQNGDFSDTTATQNGNVVSIPGWDIHLEQVALGPGNVGSGLVTNIAGHPVPIDTFNHPSSAGDDVATSRGFSYQIINGELGLTVPGQSFRSYAEIHGPFVVSQGAVALEAGDTVSFDYFAQAGGDWYDVYGYLVEETTGHTIELLNEHGPSTETIATDPSIRNTTATVPVDINGNYKFVFISGSFDKSGGRYMGGSLYISNIDVVQANPPPINETTARIDVTAEEANQVKIGSNLLTSMNSVIANDLGRTTEYFTISGGPDAAKFEIDGNGDIISKGPLSYDTQSSYQFDLQYVGSDGSDHTETVYLKLTPYKQANSNLTAIEASQVQINANTLSNIDHFANRDGKSGSYRITSTTGDAGLFSVDGFGNITSNPLNFDVKQNYSFNVIYRSTNGLEFTETVNLRITDTLHSTATLSAEQSNQVVIDASTLTSTATFRQKYLNQAIGGTFSILTNGTDWNKFTIDPNTGRITSNGQVLKNTQNQFQFDVAYAAANGQTHVESVTLNITESLQATATLSAHEANRVGVDRTDLSDLDAFAGRDLYRGFYRISGGIDAGKFQIDSSGNITSRSTLEFDNQNSFTFDVQYIGSDGRTFTETVNLGITDTLHSTATLSAEQSNQVVIDASTLTSTATFRQKYLNQAIGGTFSILTNGTDWNKFTIDPNTGRITSRQPLLQSNQLSYEFAVAYQTSTGVQHTEHVSLALTESLQSKSLHRVDEANRVLFGDNSLSRIHDFASRDGYRGVFFMDTDPVDGANNDLFSVGVSGSVVSNGVIEFDTLSEFKFKIGYQAADGRIYRQSATTLVNDTFSGSSNLQAEEAQIVQINPIELNSLKTFANKVETTTRKGTYHLVSSGEDFRKFTIDENTGFITSKGELRKSEQDSFSFQVRYVGPAGQEFIENVQLALTDTTFNTAVSDVSVKESSQVSISKSINKYMDQFAASDNYSGNFVVRSFDGTTNDHVLFYADTSGNIFSRDEIDFESGKNDFQIKVEYYHSDGIQKYSNDVTIHILNDVRDDDNLNLDGISVVTQELAADAVTTLDLALERLSKVESSIGAVQNRLQRSIEFGWSAEMLTASAKGRIIDADFAKETSSLAKQKILANASMAMLAQAKKSDQSILKLIKL